MRTCSFCDVWGSAARSETLELPLSEQIETVKLVLKKKFRAEAFLVYFQSYTTSFSKLSQLKSWIDTALTHSEIEGVVIGTRPDCISDALLEQWQQTQEKTFVAVELGVQSFEDSHLQFLARGHSVAQNLRAIERIAKKTQVNLGLHLMFGCPGETDEEVIRTARICNELPIHNVKLHNLHVLENTELAQVWRRGEFAPLDFANYAARVKLFLEHLDSRIFIHRLAAYSPRRTELLAPAWTANKVRTHQEIVDSLHLQQSFQGKALL